jgi:hypothetical protein
MKPVFLTILLLFQLSPLGLPLLYSVSAHNLETHPELYNIYQQTQYKSVDPVGDRALVNLHNRNLKMIFYVVTQQNQKLQERRQRSQEIIQELGSFYEYDDYDPIDTDYNPSKVWTPERIASLDSASEKAKESLLKFALDTEFSFESRHKPFDSQKMLSMFLQVIYEEQKNSSLKAFSSTPHAWSKEFLQDTTLIRGHSSLAFSKLLVALAHGVSSKFLVTGQEPALAAWVRAQNYNSITLDAMFRASYRLHKGDVYLSLLGITNILSRNWSSPGRNQRSLVSRLKPFTLTLNDEDTFGHWYHFFGVLTYGFAEGKLKSFLVAKTESFGSFIMSRGAPEYQENFVNSRGAIVGSELKSWLSSDPELKRFIAAPENTDPSVYLLEATDISAEIIRRAQKLTSHNKIAHYHYQQRIFVLSLISEFSQNISENLNLLIDDLILMNQEEISLNAKGKNIYNTHTQSTLIGKLHATALAEVPESFLESQQNKKAWNNMIERLFHQTKQFHPSSAKRIYYQHLLSEMYLQMPDSDPSIHSKTRDPARQVLQSRRQNFGSGVNRAR